MEIKRRALLMYATMTRNTEKIAGWFKETFEEYGWEVTYVKIGTVRKMAQMQEQLYFEDYDLIALGSPIVGGSPLQSVIKLFSFGAGGSLEKEVQKNLEEKKEDAAAGAGENMMGVMWRRSAPPAPGMAARGNKRPLGIVFTTYGGGFYGSDEAKPTLETLKMYLKQYDVDVIGKFSCGGKETGPSGYPVGVKPKAQFRPGKRSEGPDADICDAVQYRMGDGTLRPGSYFFHYDGENKPGPREEAKARAFISDIVEDYFMTYDGQVNPPLSEILSIS